MVKEKRWFKEVLLFVIIFAFISSCATMHRNWEAAKSTDTIQAYEEFLKRYPEGKFSDEACSRLEELYFQRATKANTIEVYREFLKRYPWGRFSDKARSRLEELYFQRASKTNTIEAYEEFLKHYPKGRFSEKACSRIKKLYKEMLRDVKVIRVVVEQSYGEADKVSLPFFKETKRIFETYGRIKVVGKDAQTYDATLTIQASGEALGARYGPSTFASGSFHYTVAKVTGDILLTVKGKEIKWTFSDETSLPVKIPSGSYETPNDAPFKEAFHEGFCPAIFRALSELRGIEPLISALKDKDINLRKAAAKALGEIKDPRAVEFLISALKDKESYVRYAAAKVLGEIEDPRAIAPLISALWDEDIEVYEAAVEALDKINPKWMETVEAKNKVTEFINALKDENSCLRYVAAEALGEIKDPRAVEPLIFALKDEESGVRSAAAKALGKIEDPRAVEPLISALKDKDWDVREAAAEALGEIKDPRAVAPLISALKDKVWNVHKAATKALEKITGQDFGEDQSEWQKWWEENKGRFLK